jgi:hypothetical protein
MTCLIAVKPLSEPFPLTHARIGYQNILVSTDTPAADPALIPNTFERWLSGTGNVAVRFQTAAIVGIDFVAIGAHNLGSSGAEVAVWISPTVNGVFTQVALINPTNDNAIMVLFDETVTADVKITLGGGTVDREIGYVSAGTALVMPRPIYGGHTPIVLTPETTYQQNTSSGGQFLGRNIIRKGISTNFEWNHLQPDFIRGEFQLFVQSAKTTPFFIAWRPAEYPEDVALVHTVNDIHPENMGGGHRFMMVSFEVNGHADSL